MASTKAEDGVLKIVHPGRKIQIYRKPVTASEIIKKYPRHSVTRPDVFEYPWVVVSPESVLTLSKVFFVVPNRTIYKLMKNFKEKTRDSPKMLTYHQDQSRDSPKMLTYHQDQSRDSPDKINAGSTPKHLACVSQSPPATCMCISKPDQNRDLRTRKQSKVGSWPNVNGNTSIQLREKPKPATGSRILLRSFDDDLESTDSQSTLKFRGALVKFQHGREVTKLKSCLRKPNSHRRFLRLRVSFNLPEETESSRELSKSLE